MSYESTFISGFNIAFPEPGKVASEAVYNSGELLEHNKFSILFNQERRLAAACGCNIDGAQMIAAGKIKRRSFVFDPLIPRDLQVDNAEGYSHNPWDRGHLVRRRALHWGDLEEARQADRESSYWTNIAPQHERLHSTAWGHIEDWLLELADDLDKRMSIFTGPVLLPQDPFIQNRTGEREVQIPAGYWKVVVLLHRGNLRAASFLVWQRDHDRADPVSFDPVLEQVRLTTIEYLTDLQFVDLRQADPIRFGAELAPVARGKPRAGVFQPMPAAGIVNCAEDIVL